MIVYCEKCGHNYNTTRTGVCPIPSYERPGYFCNCDCMAKPLLMTCALPPAEASPAKTWIDPPDFQQLIMDQVTGLEKLLELRRTIDDATFDHQQKRIHQLEDQIGKIPPLLDRIAAMEKTLAKLPSLNPSIIKGLRENVDWTKVMSSDEDLLEDEYRGWPVEKKRTIF